MQYHGDRKIFSNDAIKRELFETGDEGMIICGMQKTTLLDFPGHVAATLFTGGCNFRCPFCHNGELVTACEEEIHSMQIPQEEIMEFLRKRRTVLEGVCITGGEPTLQKDLRPFIEEVRGLGYLIKLDTNGYRPEVLEELMEAELLDYVAMDIKASRDRYALAAGRKHLDLANIERSISILKGQSRIPYEFRTTVVKGLHDPEEFEEIGKWLAGDCTLYLQSFRESSSILDPDQDFCAFSAKELEKMAERARKSIAIVKVRGVE